jgi:hypothetical protein
MGEVAMPQTDGPRWRPVPVTSTARKVPPRWWPAGLAWALWALAMLGILATLWLDHLLRQTSRADLSPLEEAGILLVALLSAATVGALVGSRRPAHPVGWLLLTMGLSLAALGLSWEYATYGLVARPGALPAAGYAGVVNSVDTYVMVASLGFVLLLTPTGSLPSPRWRWWARTAAAAAVVGVVTAAPLPFGTAPFQSAPNPLEVPALNGPLEVVEALSFALTGLAVPVGAWSLLLRFRRARGVERQQLRWVALAAALTAVIALVLAVMLVTGAWTPTSIELVVDVGVALLPLATGAAVLRYRLYDLDRIVSRTVAYGLVTALLGIVYTVCVLGLGQLFGGIRDQPPSWAVAAATLAVAALFQPARRRVQAAVDRRFDRRRYDAARTIEAFSARLRQQVDLDALTGELLAVVDQTMQPTQVALWLLREPATPSRRSGTTS